MNINTKDIFSTRDNAKRLVQDDYYYKYIFKKTERIVSVVFYILYNTPVNSKTESHIQDIQHSARRVHDAILQSLETYRYSSEDAIRSTAVSLIALQSKINVAHAVGILTNEIVSLLSSETDLVLRGLNKYLNEESPFSLSPSGSSYFESGTVTAPRQTVRTQKTEPKVFRENSGGVGRRERIKTILEAKGPTSIKDISLIVSDCSEKTIQRELNDMISAGLVKRQGERRWSLYSIAG